VYLRHLRATWQKKHGAKTDKYTNTQKMPSEKNCSQLFFCVSVYLFSGQRNHSLNTDTVGLLTTSGKPEEKSWTNPICVFVQVPNRHSTWRDYLCEKAEQNKYTNRFGHFVAFMCVSVQKKRLFGLSGQNRYAKEQRRTKKPSHRDLYICVSV